MDDLYRQLAANEPLAGSPVPGVIHDFGNTVVQPMAQQRAVDALVAKISANQAASPSNGATEASERPVDQLGSGSGELPKGDGGAQGSTKDKKIDRESRELLRQINLDFVMLTGASYPLAYQIETGLKYGKDSFIHFCDKHYGSVSLIDENGTETDRASAGSIWWQWSDHGKRVVGAVVMEPTSKPEHEGNPEEFNRWYVLKKTMEEPNYNATMDDAAPFINHLMQISDGDQIGVMYFLNWLATLYQFPDIKIPVAIFMYSQFGGVGKNLVQRLLSRVFGKPLVAGVSGKRLQSNFMDAIEHKRLIFINELARSDRADGYEDFKTQISEEDTQFEGKGRAAREIRNIAHYIITTNNIDALPLMQNDRRIAVLMTVEHPLDASYYKAFVKWIDGPGAGIVANLLRTWQFPADWDPHAPAPQTIAALAVQRGAQGPLYAVLEEMCESRTPPFDKNAFTAREVSVHVDKLYGSSLRCNITSGACGKQLTKMSQLMLWDGRVLRKSLGHTKPVPTQVYVHVAAVDWWKGMSPESKGDYLDTGRHLSPVQTQFDSEVADHE
ncbi:DUF5906 domain-containing protein [Pseudomonas sp. NBB]|uniref:primase-helicase family protein n=1 Tax=Pseudomonas sp. NBB TaxID=2976333 RepID=UPI00130529E0|nr:primase-helicase family protein [Pseudomonas sp. NBB]WOB56574.1 DUF5906 domain-containing protein [Pseudomonas sp. NBB]